MCTSSPQNPLTGKELSSRDRRALRLARQISLIGLICAISGGTGIIATAGQVAWDIAKMTYLALATAGGFGILYGERVFRKLMKKYLRPFSLVA